MHLDPRPRSIAAQRTYLEGGFRPATVRLESGVITAVDTFDARADMVVPEEATLLPGLVDSHVHLNEPGRTAWEGFATGTAAAAAGGVTTVVEMPLNSLPVTTTPQALAAKREVTAGKLAVDLAYWGGAVPENLGQLAELLDAGVVGVKCFLAPSGIEEFGHLEDAQLHAALAELAAVDGLLIVHAEDPAHLAPAGPLGTRYADFLDSRPPASESAAIARVIEAARATGARAHIVHVSDGASLPLVRQAKADGVRLTVETCPHYLTLTAEAVPDGAASHKCCPPIRGAANQDLLWEGVLDGTIDAIVSDHSPSTPELKETGDGDFGLAWGGIAGLQTGLIAVWTEARRRGIPLEAILPLMTTGPARVAGLGSRGTLAPGEPGHLAVFAPDSHTQVRPETLQYRHTISPWLHRTLSGAVAATYVHGDLTFTAGHAILRRGGREILPAPAAAKEPA